MYIVIDGVGQGIDDHGLIPIDSPVIGPFESEELARKWARENWDEYSLYHVRELKAPA